MPIASWPVQAETTRYPLVESMNLSTESSCSLSSTQRFTFFGRMSGKAPLMLQFVLAVAWEHFTHARSCGALVCWIDGPGDQERDKLSRLIQQRGMSGVSPARPWWARLSRQAASDIQSTGG